MPPKPTGAPAAAAPSSTPLLGALVFLTGGVILVLEIVGARLVSPVYGSSLNVWSSLITVTLLALAIGYETGGRLADRYPAHDVLQWLLGVAGAFVLAVPTLRQPVLDATAPLGLQVGALVSSALLLVVPLVLLSAAGLVVARAVTRSMERLGRGVGRISFYSTLGSVAGALATGFFLIPRFPVSRIFYGAGVAILAGMALVALDRRRTRTAGLQVFVATVAGAILLTSPVPRNPHAIFQAPTFYGEIEVLEAYPIRYLMLDGIHQSIWDVQKSENAGTYIHGLEFGPLASGGDRALVIGLGAGALPVILERHYGMVADAVDINARVVETARDYFGYATRGRTHVEDGRIFVQRSADASYDLVVLDTFNGDAIPYHLLTREFFGEVARVLRPNGVLAVNAVGLSHRQGGFSGDIRAVAATVRAVFPQVRAFGLMGPEESAQDPVLENVIVLGARVPIDAGDRGRWREPARRVLDMMAAQEISETALAGGLVLNDDYNPIDFLNAPTARVWRSRILQAS